MNRLTKWFNGLTKKASTGSISGYTPSVSSHYGQPPYQLSDVESLITPERMRELVMKTPTAAACMNAILDYVSGVVIKPRNRDASAKVNKHIATDIHTFLDSPNTENTGREFRRIITRDMVTLGWAAAEIELDDNGNVANLWPLDTAKLRIDFDETGRVLGYNMMNQMGQPIVGDDGVHSWEPEQLIIFAVDMQSKSPYASSRISQMFALGIIESLICSFIGDRFTISNVPYGVLDIGEVTEDELKSAVAIWNQQMAQLGQSKMILTGSKGMHFIPFTDQLKDMHPHELLQTIRGQIMGILGVTVNELGEAGDVNKSNGFNLSYTFKKRAIEPVLDTLVDKLTHKLVWKALGYTSTELYYEEIDSRDELLQAQIDEAYLKNGIWSINHVRNRKGLPSVEGGDTAYITLGQNSVPVAHIEAFAQAQLDALLLETEVMRTQIAQVKQAMATGGKAPKLSAASPPIIRGPQPPERFTTIGGSGSTTTKFELPKPSLSTPQKPRGPVQKTRNIGVRKEEMA